MSGSNLKDDKLESPLSLNDYLISSSFIASLNESATPLIKPCIPLGVTWFSFMTGKSSWVPSRTQGFIPLLLQMVRCSMGIAQLASTLRMGMSRSWARSIYLSYLYAIIGCDVGPGTMFQLSVRLWTKTLFASAIWIWTWYCNIYFVLRCNLLFVNLCTTMNCCMLNSIRSGLYGWKIEILRDFTDYRVDIATVC